MITLTFYMKSGARIKLRGIQDWKVEATGNVVTTLSIKRHPLAIWLGFPRLIINSIDLSQIDAIVAS